MPFANPYTANPYPYAFAQTLTTANQLYDFVESLVSGVYTITWNGGGTLNVDFYNGTTYIGTATGTSSITYNLAQSATGYKMWNTVGNVSVVISLTALALAPVSGVLTTYTTSQTITATGDGYAVLVGGGGGGGGGFSSGVGGGGGGSGGIVGSRIVLTGSLALVIGTGGTGGVAGTPGTNGNPGIASTFAGLTAGGGGGGIQGGGGAAGGTAGSPGGGAGGAGNGVNPGGTGSPSSNSNSFFTIFQQGTTGGGGGGTNTGSVGVGAGTGIGTGGNGGGGSSPGGNGTGFGSGGGGGGFGGAGGNGMPGVLYLIV